MSPGKYLPSGADSPNSSDLSLSAVSSLESSALLSSRARSSDDQTGKPEIKLPEIKRDKKW